MKEGIVMKKICIVFPYSMGDDFLSGGVTKLVIENVEAAVEKYETHLVMPINNQAFMGYVNKNIPNAKVHLVDFDFFAQYADTSNICKRIIAIVKRAIRTILKKKNLKKEILKIQPEVVHLHAEVSYIFLKMIKKLGYKTIFHTSSLRFAENKILKNMVVRTAKKYADCVVSPTKSIDNLYSNKEKYIVENPIVLPTSKKEMAVENDFKNDTRLKFVFTGRICRVKQIHYLIEAFAKLPKEIFGKISFYVIGKANNDGDMAYYTEILGFINDNNLNNVYFLGYKTNVSDYLKYTDVGVLLSKSEAISMSSVEYMYAGVPVLGFDNPGINEVVIDKYNGVLAQDGNIEEIQTAIQYFLNIDELQEMKKNAKKYADEHFSKEVFGANILNIYKEIING